MTKVKGGQILRGQKGQSRVTFPTSDDKDSLAVFARNGKREYTNRFTEKIAVSQNYTRAWIFSEGLVAVEKESLVNQTLKQH